MPFRYFYSTDESDAALKAILAGQDIFSGGALVAGVYEYRVLLDSDLDFVKLANDIMILQIRALASPERITQFGTILPSNYFNTAIMAAGCIFRDSDSLKNLITAFKGFAVGTIIAQRDIEIQGSASLGTVLLTLSSLYSKTYNTPINGSVSDTTLVKAIIDSTTPTDTETSAVANLAMFDFSQFYVNKPVAVTHSAQIITSDTDTNCLKIVTDNKFSTKTLIYQANNPAGYVYFDFGSIKNQKATVFFSAYISSSSLNVTLDISTDNVNWTNPVTVAISNTSEASFLLQTAALNMQYARITLLNNGTVNVYAFFKEVWGI